MGEKCLGKIGINVKKVPRLCYSVYENNEQKLTKLSSITHPVSLYIFYFTKKNEENLTYF